MMNNGPFLVPSTFENASVDEHQVCGLLMPKYDRSLAIDESNISLDVIYRRAKEMETALGYMHSKSVIHMDIKPANIFIDYQGTWWLGDYGSCVTEGDSILSTTEFFYPTKIIGTPARAAYDWYMLCGVVVSKMMNGDLIHENLDNFLRTTITKCLHPLLKECLETFMRRHDEVRIS